jgi:hypothetical protein
VDGEAVSAEEGGEASDLGQFMEKIGRSRTGRQLRGTGTDG